MTALDDAINRIRDRSSLFWAFYDPDEFEAFDTIEVSLNGTTDQAGSLDPPIGWTLHRIQWGDTVFIRRHQSMDERSVGEMLCGMLRFADANRMRFWSWQAGLDRLAPDGFHPAPANRPRR